MAKPGRPMTPARIKKLSGTIRKDRTREGIEFNLITKIPKPEVWLDAKAKRYFKNICELLISKQLLNDANVPLVLIMAQEFATYERATRELKEGMVITTGKNDYEQPSPWVSIRNQSQKNYRDIASLFGLDPLSAMKVGPGKKSDQDDFEKIMDKYKSKK